MIIVPSTLDAVTVHAEGALCRRLAWVAPEQERLPRQVRVEGLPLGLSPGSLRAFVVSGPADLRVRDVRPTFDARLPPEPELPATQLALEEAQEVLAALRSELERVRRDVADLCALEPHFPPHPEDAPFVPREPALPALLSLADFVDTELAARQARLLELERQERDAEAEVELRRERLREGSSAARGQRAQLHRAALLTLSDSMPASGRVQLALEYAVPGARWVPGYELHLPRTLDGGTLRMRASVVQRTGEDWSQVRLSLSTAPLERRVDVPELKSLRIGRRQPPPPRSGWREPPPGLDALFAGYDAALPPLAPPPPPPERALVREFAMPPPPAPPPAPAPAAPRMARISQSMPSLSAKKPMAPGASYGGGGPPAPKSAPPSLGGLMGRREKEEAKRSDLDDDGEDDVLEGASADMSFSDEAELAEIAAEAPGGAPPMRSRSRGGAASASEPVPSRAALTPEEQLLDYGRLELGAANEPGGRGRLRPRPESAEQLVVMGVHLQLDVFAFVARWEQTAEAVRYLAPPAGCVPPQDSAPDFAHRFDVGGRVDVPSDGRWHTVPVLSAAVGLSAEYQCVPSLEPHVFRTVKLDNPTAQALLAGPVDVMLGDEFLMTSPLPTLAPGATQRLGLGVEESLKVSRHTRFEEQSGGMFNNVSLLTHHVTVELGNRLARPVTVEVLERVPAIASSEKDIKLEEAEVKPAWSRRATLPGETPVEGERAWKLTLKPGETSTLQATWSVRIPANKMLQGGNRRT